MSQNYRGYSINDATTPAPWGVRETQWNKDIIDNIGGDCIQSTSDTGGHKHGKFYATGGNVIMRSDTNTLYIDMTGSSMLMRGGPAGVSAAILMSMPDTTMEIGAGGTGGYGKFVDVNNNKFQLDYLGAHISSPIMSSMSSDATVKLTQGDSRLELTNSGAFSRVYLDRTNTSITMSGDSGGEQCLIVAQYTGAFDGGYLNVKNTGVEIKSLGLTDSITMRSRSADSYFAKIVMTDNLDSTATVVNISSFENIAGVDDHRRIVMNNSGILLDCSGTTSRGDDIYLYATGQASQIKLESPELVTLTGKPGFMNIWGETTSPEIRIHANDPYPIVLESGYSDSTVQLTSERLEITVSSRDTVHDSRIDMTGGNLNLSAVGVSSSVYITSEYNIGLNATGSLGLTVNGGSGQVVVTGELGVTGKVGFNGATTQDPYVLGVDSSDLTSVVILANGLRAMAIACGLGTTT